MHSIALTARRWRGGENGARMRHLKSMKNGEIDPNWRPSAPRDRVTYLSSYHPLRALGPPGGGSVEELKICPNMRQQLRNGKNKVGSC